MRTHKIILLIGSAAVLSGGFTTTADATVNSLEPWKSTPRSAAPLVATPMDTLEASALWELDVQPIIQGLRDGFPDSFSVAWIGDRSLEVAFSGIVPAGAWAVINKSPVPTTVVENFGLSDADMARLGADVHDMAVREAGEGFAIASGPNAGTKTFDVEISASDTARRSVTDVDAVRKIEESLTAAFPPESLGGFGVTVSAEAPGSIGDASFGEAGGTVLNLPNGTPECTSGFVMSSRTNADLGIITAGHCADSLRQGPPNGGWAFNLRLQHRGDYGDAQWMRSPVMMDAWFHYDHGLGRPQQARGDAAINSTVYVYGNVGGRQSAQVRSTNYSKTGTDGYTVRGLVRVNGSTVRNGDSGGPVYLGNTAFGIIQGYTAYDDLYTPITPILSLFNLDLCIDPPGCQ